MNSKIQRYIFWTDICAGVTMALLPGFLTHWLYPLLNAASVLSALLFLTAAWMLRREHRMSVGLHTAAALFALFKGAVLLVLLLDAVSRVWGLYGSLGRVIGSVQLLAVVAVVVVYFPYPAVLLLRFRKRSSNGASGFPAATL